MGKSDINVTFVNDAALCLLLSGLCWVGMVSVITIPLRFVSLIPSLQWADPNVTAVGALCSLKEISDSLHSLYQQFENMQRDAKRLQTSQFRTQSQAAEALIVEPTDSRRHSVSTTRSLATMHFGATVRPLNFSGISYDLWIVFVVFLLLCCHTGFSLGRLETFCKLIILVRWILCLKPNVEFQQAAWL